MNDNAKHETTGSTQSADMDMQIENMNERNQTIAPNEANIMKRDD